MMTAQQFYSEVWVKEHGADPRGDWPIRFAEAYAAERARQVINPQRVHCVKCGNAFLATFAIGSLEPASFGGA